MSTSEDRQALEANVQGLLDLLDRQRDKIPPETRVATLGTVVQAQAMMQLTDAITTAARTLVYDGLQPLMRRLPER